MENNKILIGVGFIKPGKNEEFYVMQLIVLRDLILKQLIEGIKYGLEKKIKTIAGTTNNVEKNIYLECQNIFNNCINNKNPFYISDFKKRESNKSNTRESNKLDLEESGDEKLCDLGFITSSLIIFPSDREYDSNYLIADNSQIIPAFNFDSDPTSEKIFPDYNISTRQRNILDTTPFSIIPSPDLPQKQKQNIFLMLLPTIAMIVVMVLVRGFLMVHYIYR